MGKGKTKRYISQGRCNLCRELFAKNVVTRHLQSCPKRKLFQGKGTTLFHLLVEGQHSPEYWLHIEVPATMSLKNIDNFLRNIWLECCGHLSAFRIHGKTFMTHPQPEYGDKGMNVRLENILSTGLSFSHEYDFGTTTYLNLKVLSTRETQEKIKLVQILAKNNPPPIICGDCGKPATQLCTECMWDEEKGPELCVSHAASHTHDEDMFLPVVNSPRVGMCGYVG